MPSKNNKICIPGERLFAEGNEYKSGIGTYVTHSYIYASLAGYLYVIKNDLDPSQPSLVQVQLAHSEKHAVPFIGAVVTAKVLHIGPRFSKCSIVCVEESILVHPFNAQIRKEDVRATEIDKVEMNKSYRPGDVILARVVNFDSQTSFLLSTAEDHLGVVSAKCEEGHKLKPINWTEMQCIITGDKEYRKVAKVPHINEQ